MNQRVSREQVREALTGPVTSVKIPFQRDGGIDFIGLRAYVEFVLAAGSRALILTYGDSLYSVLSDREVEEVTRAVVKDAAGRALVVAGDRMWATPQAVAFARYAREAGAHLVMPLLPTWANSPTPQTFVAHYARVAEEMPVMLITAALATYPMPMRLEVIERTRDEVDGVMAIKDDVIGSFARRMSLLVYDRWAVISGGLKENHLSHLPYGCDGYFSSFMKFRPEVAHAYWRAVQGQDWAAVRQIIGEIEAPWFDLIMGLPGGFDAGIHGTLELFGICGRWRRMPYHTLSDAEMEPLRAFYQKRGWL
jgi:dihydrodipicolinate synthase/N-acetylneuraminate lyase